MSSWAHGRRPGERTESSYGWTRGRDQRLYEPEQECLPPFITAPVGVGKTKDRLELATCRGKVERTNIIRHPEAFLLQPRHDNTAIGGSGVRLSEWIQSQNAHLCDSLPLVATPASVPGTARRVDGVNFRSRRLAMFLTLPFPHYRGKAMGTLGHRQDRERGRM